MTRSKDQHYQELTDHWLNLHGKISKGTANAVEVRELVFDLMTYCTRHWNDEECKWITEQALSDLNRWLEQHIENGKPEQTGKKDHRIHWFDLVRYRLVRDLVSVGVRGRKDGDCPELACKYAAAYLKHYGLPAGRKCGGAGKGFVSHSAIKSSFQRIAKDPERADGWQLPGDDEFVEVTPNAISALEQANPSLKKSRIIRKLGE